MATPPTPPARSVVPPPPTPAAPISVLQLHQMLFIYNAVMDGWTVKRLPNGNFKFKKRCETVTERRTFQADSFLSRFVTNMQRLRSTSSAPRLGNSTDGTNNIQTDQITSFELPADQDVI